MTEPASLHDAEQTLEATQAKRHAAYPAYRPSGLDWLGDLPEHWDVRRLKFIATTIMGQSPSSDDYTVDEDAMPFLQGNAEFGSVNPTARYYCDAATKQAPIGSLLISVRAPVGAVNIADRSYGIGRGLCAVVPDSRVLLPAFTWHALPVTRNELWSIATGSTYEAVSANEVAAMSMPLPPLEEQQAIARFLDEETKKIDDLIEAKRDLLALLKEKRQAVITHAVTKGLNPEANMKASGLEWLGDIPEHWTLKPLRYLGEAIIGLTYSPDDVVDESEGVLVLRASNIQGGHIVDGDNVYVDVAVPDRLRVQANDILICSRSGSRDLIGKNALISSDVAGCTFGAFMTVLRSKYNDFIYWVLNSRLFTFHAGAFMTTTINQLTLGTLKAFAIPLPPPPEQKAIVDHITARISVIDDVIADVVRALGELSEMRTALISAAVTGKIDVRGGAA